MQYKIGDVSKILGISPDLLRYYQKKGVVKPTLGASNNYRYYDAWDINFLIDCLWFKKYGFGIEQTAKLVSASSFDDVMADMHARCTEIEENISASRCSSSGRSSTSPGWNGPGPCSANATSSTARRSIAS